MLIPINLNVEPCSMNHEIYMFKAIPFLGFHDQSA